MVNPAVLGQTIAVFDKSGKVVGNSKHLLNVFKEAKLAYRERKAEIITSRQGKGEGKHIRRALIAGDLNDGRSSISSRASRPRSPRSDVLHRKPVPQRRYSGDSAASSVYPASNRRFEQDLHGPHSRSQRSRSGSLSPRSPHQDMVRRHTTMEDYPERHSAPSSPVRSRSSSAIDMDLAYGELPLPMVVARNGDETELKGLVGTVKRLLDEADCVQYSATAIIANLQKNPEAMAAVALTLAEISNIVTKMSPGVVMAMRGSAPAVFALLASPQFLIAAGVGVGITVIAFGGYKIIKKIKAKHAMQDPTMDEMIEIGGDANRIENWRRGISEAQESSVGTSVEGEFITPMAANLSRLNLREERVRESRREADGLNSVKGTKTLRSGKSSSRHSKDSKDSKESRTKTEKIKKERKEKKPSPLRLMFS